MNMCAVNSTFKALIVDNRDEFTAQVKEIALSDLPEILKGHIRGRVIVRI